MRVAILTCVYPPYGGGIGQVAYHNARLVAREHEVTVFTPHYPGRAFQTAPGVQVEPVKPGLSYGNAAWLPRLKVRLAEFDIVHLHYPFFGVHEFLTSLPEHTKLIVTYHMVPASPGLKGLVFKLDASLFERRLAARANLLITQTTDYLKAVALPRLGQALKWQVVPLGVGGEYSPGEPPDPLRRRLNLRELVPVVMFVGSLDTAHAFKGVEVLLRAMAELKQRTWYLLIVGKGNLRTAFEADAHKLGIHRQVIFTGFVPEPELPDYYRLGSIFVLPATNGAETFGLAALQAMAVGLPVVASNLPGVRSVVRDHNTGLLVQPGDAVHLAAAIDELLLNRDLARRLGTAGRELVTTTFRWEAIGEKLLRLYASLS